MKSYPPAKIRNVALVGHGGAGKTSLAEALLFCSGASGRLGRVDTGTATTDGEPEEIRRHQSLSLSVAPCEHDGHKINLLVAPGYADFANDMETALSMADLAIVVVSAVDGVQVQTEAAWNEAAAMGLPRMIFINKLDRERASFERTLDQLRDLFGAGVAPLELPIGEEGSFRGVADLLTDTAFLYDLASQNNAAVPSRGPIPEDMAALERQVHDNLVEGIVVADDDLTERYLEGDAIGSQELEETLAHGVASANVFPVVCGSATRLIGIDRLAALICEVGPSPLARPPAVVFAGNTTTEVAPDPAGPPLAVVFRTVADPYVGKVSYLKILSGTLRPDTVLTNPRTHADERLHGLFIPRGKDAIPVGELGAGDIGAVAKLGHTGTGDTLAPKGMPVTVPATAIPKPVLSVAIRPRSKGDDDKLMTALARLGEEDRALQVRRDDETHQTLLWGMGETHLSVALERLSRKFGVEVETTEVRVPYRETITAGAGAEGRYKKQTGGHGQFGVAVLKVEPLARGGGFEFVDKIVGGAIPRQFIPAVEKGVTDTMAAAGLWGYPVVDVRVTLTDGKFHPVDSSEMSFRMAGSMAFKEAMAKAGPVLLEPISHLEVTVAFEHQGDVMGDLNARRGRVQGTEAVDNGEHLVTALVPTSELLRYAVDLRSLTGGRGRFTATHDHYDTLPGHLIERVAATKGDRS